MLSYSFDRAVDVLGSDEKAVKWLENLPGPQDGNVHLANPVLRVFRDILRYPNQNESGTICIVVLERAGGNPGMIQ